MKLKILTWNLNFFYDNWYNRIISINKVLEKEISTNDIIVLQEATIPYLKTPGSIYTCLKKSCLNYSYHHTFSDEIKIISDKLKGYYPEKQEKIMTLFAYFMDKLLLVSSYFFSKFGHILQNLYFTQPLLCSILAIFFFPIIIFGGYMFLGMMTIINKKIKTTVKSKFVGRLFQYCEFTYNKKDILLCNLHLNEGNDSNKGYKEFQKILDFIKSKTVDVVILAGDFNSPPTSKIYKQLYEEGFKSTIKEINEKDIKTWPSLNPTTCIDYIWVKGDVEICSADVFGDNNSTDHKGVRCCIDIQ